jgi:hypothetical protein
MTVTQQQTSGIIFKQDFHILTTLSFSNTDIRGRDICFGIDV